MSSSVKRCKSEERVYICSVCNFTDNKPHGTTCVCGKYLCPFELCEEAHRGCLRKTFY